MIFKNLRTIVALALVLVLGVPLEARTRKGDRFYKQAQDIYLENLPILIAYINATAYAWNSKIQGVVVHGDPSHFAWDIMKWSKSA